MDRRDWVLLALLAAPEKRLQPVQLQKSLFLVRQRIAGIGGSYYSFAPYHYGPFSREVYEDADSLSAEGLVANQRSPGNSWRDYVLTDRGMVRALLIEQDANRRALDYLKKAVPWACALSFEELVRSIYTHFPEYRVNSVFQDPGDSK